MLFLLIGILVTIFGFIGYKVFDWDEGGPVLVVVGIAFLAVFLIAVPVSLLDNNAHIESFKSVQLTLLNARLNQGISEFELATIQKEVVDCNQWLAKQRVYANQWMWEWYYQTKKINELEIIK